MIATLRGKIAEKTLDMVLIECGGIGYGVFVPFEDFGALEEGQETKLHIYEHIRENAHDLFGFRDPQSKILFELLLSVNGVGPRMALSILSIASLSNVRQAIATGDVKFITQAVGVGRKVAERVVVDLKDKVGLAPDESATDFLTATANPNDEALQGLVALGFSVQDAAAALKKVDAKLAPEDRIKAALKA